MRKPESVEDALTSAIEKLQKENPVSAESAFHAERHASTTQSFEKAGIAHPDTMHKAQSLMSTIEFLESKQKKKVEESDPRIPEHLGMIQGKNPFYIKGQK